MRHRELVLRGLAYNCGRLAELLLLLICRGFLLNGSTYWRGHEEKRSRSTIPASHDYGDVIYI